MQHQTSGNLDNDFTPPNPIPEEWAQISIRSQSLEQFCWEIICDERWTDPHKDAYECHRITRKTDALGGHLYAVATHIIPHLESAPPSVSESLIFVPLDAPTEVTEEAA
jgi:hypothetical protein